MKAPYSIPCPHEMNRALDTSLTLPYYHPLTLEELRELVTLFITRKGLDMTYYKHEVQAASSVQVRICQAVPGLVCPYQIEGPIAVRHERVNSLLFSKKSITQIVEKIWAIFQEK